MESESSIANAVGGKTARACDSCIRKRARWYCAADDAFLCQACDAIVHSANPLARRHERVRLKTSSLKLSLEKSAPSWHKGFTKKARTPRHAKLFDKEPRKNLIHSVPEVSVDENSHEENEEHDLLHRVPSCDHFLSEQFLTSRDSKDVVEAFDHACTSKSKSSNMSVNDGHEVESLHGLFLPSEMDIAEFAADVESLLGKGLDDDCYGMESLGLIDEFNNAKNTNSLEFCFPDDGKVKLEEENSGRADENSEIQIARESFEISFGYESAATCGDEEVKAEDKVFGQGSENSIEKRISLSLDYEAIIAAWSSNETPWFTGDRPHVDLNEGWTDYRGTWGTEIPYNHGGNYPGIGRHIGGEEGGREARVSRYREKRRNRLFSKKIRYEVRKLNAEKRPRMKGRFVKRAALSATIPYTL